MHGQQTMKYLNDKAVADAILNKHTSEQKLSEQQTKDFAEALAKKAK